MSPSRDGATDVRLVSKVLVDDVVLAAHEHSTGAVTSAWHRDEMVCLVLKGLTVLAHHMVETEVQLVEGEGLNGRVVEMKWTIKDERLLPGKHRVESVE